jgi:anti-sigma factor ChrR (cupin superfamily)
MLAIFGFGATNMLNMDFTRRVVIPAEQQQWEPSPSAGVWRRRFAFEEVERGHATSVVRFAPGSAFSRHGHPLGEEIFVVDGVFSDESGDFPAGTYFRNPEGFAHAPRSAPGCTLFVKLHQFAPDDGERLCIDTRRGEWQPGEDGIETLPLHRFAGATTDLLRCPAGSRLRHSPRSVEWFLVSGVLADEHGRYTAGSWLRDPAAEQNGQVVESDALVLVKRGHLPV